MVRARVEYLHDRERRKKKSSTKEGRSAAFACRGGQAGQLGGLQRPGVAPHLPQLVIKYEHCMDVHAHRGWRLMPVFRADYCNTAAWLCLLLRGLRYTCMHGDKAPICIAGTFVVFRLSCVPCLGTIPLSIHARYMTASRRYFLIYIYYYFLDSSRLEFPS